ncbi:hypothetical protein E2J97_18600 [Vibrio cholerae]|uniref:hypothetical protein n=1 Tax=Vibrio cholerae TaxID=666 RepID=UPI001C30E5F6|nr:hypothetical protein [Vibrio cholerae]
MSSPFSNGVKEPENLDKSEKEIKDQLSNDEIAANNRHKAAITADIEGNRKLKKKLAYKTFDFMVRFVNFIGIILIFYVGHFISNGKPLPENFMIALVTTTLATVIGLVGFILKGLFGTK